jgi:hypothetical protein
VRADISHLEIDQEERARRGAGYISFLCSHASPSSLPPSIPYLSSLTSLSIPGLSVFYLNTLPRPTLPSLLLRRRPSVCPSIS